MSGRARKKNTSLPPEVRAGRVDAMPASFELMEGYRTKPIPVATLVEALTKVKGRP